MNQFRRKFSWSFFITSPIFSFELIQKILEYSSEKKDIVLDPFIGSGQVAVVSKSLGRRYLGFEIVPDYYKFAKKRLDKDLYRIKKSK